MSLFVTVASRPGDCRYFHQYGKLDGRTVDSIALHNPESLLLPLGLSMRPLRSKPSTFNVTSSDTPFCPTTMLAAASILNHHYVVTPLSQNPSISTTRSNKYPYHAISFNKPLAFQSLLHLYFARSYVLLGGGGGGRGGGVWTYFGLLPTIMLKNSLNNIILVLPGEISNPFRPTP